MKFIFTRRSKYGVFDSVGMNNRMIWNGKTLRGARRAAKQFAEGQPVRIEQLDSVNIYKDAVYVETIYE